MQGLPLQSTWNDTAKKWRDAIYYHYYEKGFGATPHYGVRTEQYKLIRYYDMVDSWEFYDLKNDPMEMNNLYGQAKFKGVQNELHIKLKELERQYNDNNADLN